MITQPKDLPLIIIALLMQIADAFRVMSAEKLQIEYTHYKPLNLTTVQKIPKLVVAMLTDRAFE